MVFSSTIFLFIFLPIVFIGYYLMPWMTAKNLLLVAASLIFYAFGEPVYVLIMIGCVCANYIFGRMVGSSRPWRKTALATAVIFNVSIIGVFKYTDFLLENINGIFGTDIPLPGIPLPIGISFFTFQAMSYVIDVYRNPERTEKNFIHLLLYISFFPQLVAGPIVKFDDIARELSFRKAGVSEIAEGIRRFICGLGKKLLIANAMGQVCDSIFAMDQVNMPLAWLAAISYTLQIYFDFSGYSDMAIGLGKMFGFHFKENFNYPYISTSVTVFWRRWHISLSSWFRDYLYIPLGGNRKGKVRTYINKYIVFFTTGLWHGASWNFVLWGLFHGTFAFLEEKNIIPREKLEKSVFGHIYLMLVVIIGFTLFRADTLTQAGQFIGQMFTGFHFELPLMQAFAAELSPVYLLTLAAAVILSVPVKEKIKALIETRLGGEKTYQYVSFFCSLLLLEICLLSLSSGTYNPFIYFRF